MDVIELAGRLREIVILNGRTFQCKDVNLDGDFLLLFSKELIKKVDNDETQTKLYYTKFFKDEIIPEVKFNIVVNEKSYKIKLTRDTYDEKIIIGCIIEPVDAENELFQTIYKLKISIIGLLNEVCENSRIFMLQDFNNELICQKLYLQIHKVESRLRNLLTKYLMKKYGRLLLSKSLQSDVDDYAKWFKKETSEKYNTFKRINTDYANLDFSKIIKLLDLYDAKYIDTEGNSLMSELETLTEGLGEDVEYKDINKQIAKIKEKIAKRKKVFDDSPSEKEKNEIKALFGIVNVTNDISTILDNDFRALWGNELSKMRNMVAHNKPICEELFNDILTKCEEADKKFDECFEFINHHFFSDEEGVLNALEDMAYEEEERNYFDIEAAREEVGIEFSLSEDVVEDLLIDQSKTIQRFIDTISVLGNMRGYIERIEELNEAYRSVDDDDITIDFKSRIFNIIVEELGLERDFRSISNFDLVDIIYELLYWHINIDEAIDFYSVDSFSSYSDERFERLSLNYQVNWLSLDSEKFEVDFYGELNPENGSMDLLDFNLKIDNEKKKTYTIQINYGDYNTLSEGSIEDDIVYELVTDIEQSVNELHTKFEKVDKIAEKLKDELDKYKLQCDVRI